MNYPSDWSAISVPGDPVTDEGLLYFIGSCPSSYLSEGDHPFSGCLLDSPVDVQINAFQLDFGTTTKEFYDEQQAAIRSFEKLAGENEILEKDNIEISGLSAIQTINTREGSGGSIGKLLDLADVENPTSKHLSLFLVNANGSGDGTKKSQTREALIKSMPEVGNHQNFLTNVIPAAGIILAFVSPIVTSAFNPILDYTILEDPDNDMRLSVKINNFGLVTAKKIDVYFYSSDKDFKGFYSLPVIFNGTAFQTSDELGQPRNGIFYIQALPPRSETLVTAVTNDSMGTDDKVMVFLRSDVSVGVHNVGYLTAAYLIYALALALNTGFIMWRKWFDNPDDKYILFIVDVYFAVAIFLVIFLGVCEGSGNCLSHGITIH